MGFKIDEIVHPESKATAEDFKCGICLCLTDRPVQTVCDHIYCEECVQPCMACPTCRTAFPEGRESWQLLEKCNKPMTRMLHNLKVWCPYHENSRYTPPQPLADIDEASLQASDAHAEAVADSGAGPEAESPEGPSGGRAERCTWAGSYTDLLATHLPKCVHHWVPCPAGCGQIVQRGKLDAHSLTCSKSFEVCTICQTRVRAGQMHAHRSEQSELHAQLLEVKCAELEARARGDRLDHVLASLQRLEVKCDSLSRRIPRGGQPVGSFYWTPGKWGDYRQQPKLLVESKYFEVQGQNLFLRFYPNGNGRVASAVAGDVFVYSRWSSVRLAGTITCCGRTKNFDTLQVPGWRSSGQGWREFPPRLENDDDIEFSLEIFRVTVGIETE